MDHGHPGFVLSEALKQLTITPSGNEINHKGMHISIPKDSTTAEGSLKFATSFSDAGIMPDGVESVSPAYIVETN